MKLQLDTTAKTIKIEKSINLGELTESLEKLLPNGLWKEFKLETNSIIEWRNPVIIDRYVPYRQPWWEWCKRTYSDEIMVTGTCTTNLAIDLKNKADLIDGTYNVEM